MNNKQDQHSEQPAPEEAAEVIQSAAEEMEQAADKTAEELAHWKDVALRAHADMENLRKRVAIDLEKNTKYACADFAKDMLYVADCLEAAIDHAKKEVTEKTDPVAQKLLEGVEMTYKKLQDGLKKHRVERIESLDKVFDPNFHKVVQEVEDAKPAGTIVQELQAGYTIGGDRVLRDATVVVSKGQ